MDFRDTVEMARQSHGTSDGNTLLKTSRHHGGEGVGDHWGALEGGKKLVVAACEAGASACCQKYSKRRSAGEVHK
jgi:hypothetical protein